MGEKVRVLRIRQAAQVSKQEGVLDVGDAAVDGRTPWIRLQDEEPELFEEVMVKDGQTLFLGRLEEVDAASVATASPQEWKRLVERS